MELISRFWGYVSNHRVWSAVIAAVLATATVMIVVAISDAFQQPLLTALAGIMVSIRCWIVATHEVVGWMIIILSLLSLFAIVFIGFFVSDFLKKEVTFLDYTSDELFGIKWSWSWRFKERRKKYIILKEPRCPQCSSELMVHRGSTVIPQIYCINDSCKWLWNFQEWMPSAIKDRMSYDKIEEKVRTEIDRKATTGEYKKPS